MGEWGCRLALGVRTWRGILARATVLRASTRKHVRISLFERFFLPRRAGREQALGRLGLGLGSLGVAPSGQGASDHELHFGIVRGRVLELVGDLPGLGELLRLEHELQGVQEKLSDLLTALDRKSTRLNSSHSQISYAV